MAVPAPYALGGVARGGATRGGYISGLAFITIAGVKVGYVRDPPPSTNPPHFGTLIESLTITDTLNETPNTANFRIFGWVPPQGAPVTVTLGTINSLSPIFAGFALTVTQLYLGGYSVNVAADVACVDYTWELGFTHVTGRYTGYSLTAIILDLIATYAAVNGFTTHNVTPGLPAIDEITFTETELPSAITQACQRVGAEWYVDYQKDLHVFFTDATRPQPVDLTPAHRSLANFSRVVDRTQALARVFVEGRGSTVIGDVQLGDTAIPLADVSMFEVASDTFAKVSFQGSSGGAQYIDFTGVVPGGGGALVGPGVAPGAAMAGIASAGGSVDTGTHSYAYTWVTASGETMPAPASSVATGQVSPPSGAPINLNTHPTGNYAYGNYLTPGDIVNFCSAFEIRDANNQNPQATTAGPVSAWITVVNNNDINNPNQGAAIHMDVPCSPDPSVKFILLYMSSQMYGGGLRLSLRFPNVAGAQTTHVQTVGWSYNLSGDQPVGVNQTGRNTINLTGVSVGPSAVTARKIYRSAANTTTPLKLVATVANNTATTYTDAAADATLGAASPATDTSGLQQPTGSVPAGSTSFPIAGSGSFLATGGWAVIGNGEQTIRYATITGNTLAGIPASGIGSITAAIAFNSTVTSAPMLTGIPASGYFAISSRGLVPGDELYQIVQRDNEQTRSALANAIGGNGVREDWVQDRRLSAQEARDRGDATLAMRPIDQYTIRYTCRDLRTASGAYVSVNLPVPTNIGGTYRIQSVTISNFRPYPTQLPTYTVQASSQAFTFDDWLRILKTVQS